MSCADGPAERIHLLIDVLGLAVVVDLDALGLARTVVGHEDVVPALPTSRRAPPAPAGILVPGADDLHSGAAALHREVPAAVGVGDVHAGQERAVDGVGNLDPGAAREGLVGLDVAQIAQIGSDARGQANARGPGATSRPGGFPPVKVKVRLGRDDVAQGVGSAGSERRRKLEPLVARSSGRRRAPASAASASKAGWAAATSCVVRLLGGVDLSRQRRVARRVLGPRHAEDRRRVHDVLVHGRLRGVPEERRHAVEVLRA